MRRNSTLRDLTGAQRNALYALAGCKDVLYRVSNVAAPTRRAFQGLYGITPAVMALWFKNMLNRSLMRRAESRRAS
jgi:hypothetical protein